MECMGLRVKDLDLSRRELGVCDGKGRRDRVTMLPERLIEPLGHQLGLARGLHHRDLETGFGRASLPEALARKYPTAERDWSWQWVIPAGRCPVDPRSGTERRHHVNESGVQRAVKQAVRDSGVAKPGSCHTLRHNFATRLLEGGYDIRIVQELLGQRNVKTTMIYTHVLNRGRRAVPSPLDGALPESPWDRQPGPISAGAAPPGKGKGRGG